MLGEYSYELFDKKILTQLDDFREAYGRSLRINDWHTGGQYKESGLREIQTKTGARKSAHKFGYAFDVKHFDRSDLTALRDFIKERGAEFGISRVENFDKTPSWCHIEFSKEEVKEIYFFNP